MVSRAWLPSGEWGFLFGASTDKVPFKFRNCPMPVFVWPFKELFPSRLRSRHLQWKSGSFLFFANPRHPHPQPCGCSRSIFAFQCESSPDSSGLAPTEDGQAPPPRWALATVALWKKRPSPPPPLTHQRLKRSNPDKKPPADSASAAAVGPERFTSFLLFAVPFYWFLVETYQLPQPVPCSGIPATGYEGYAIWWLEGWPAG